MPPVYNPRITRAHIALVYDIILVPRMQSAHDDGVERPRGREATWKPENPTTSTCLFINLVAATFRFRLPRRAAVMCFCGFSLRSRGFLVVKTIIPICNIQQTDTHTRDHTARTYTHSVVQLLPREKSPSVGALVVCVTFDVLFETSGRCKKKKHNTCVLSTGRATRCGAR